MMARLAEVARKLHGEPIEEIEDNLRKVILESTEKMILELSAAIETNPARALSVIETVSSNQRRLLAMLGEPPAKKSTIDAEFEPPSGLSLPSLGGIETFGAQLIKDLLPLIAQRWGPDDKPTFNSLGVNALVNCIREAKEMGDGDLEKKLRDKLDQLLAGEVEGSDDTLLPPKQVRAEDYLEPEDAIVKPDDIVDEYITQQHFIDDCIRQQQEEIDKEAENAE